MGYPSTSPLEPTAVSASFVAKYLHFSARASLTKNPDRTRTVDR